MPRYWVVTATITRRNRVGDNRTSAQWSTDQVPAFLLDSHIQGITTEHDARKVADSIVRTLAGREASVTFTVVPSVMD